MLLLVFPDGNRCEFVVDSTESIALGVAYVHTYEARLRACSAHVTISVHGVTHDLSQLQRVIQLGSPKDHITVLQYTTGGFLRKRNVGASCWSGTGLV
jgi:hypothetical protein